VKFSQDSGVAGGLLPQNLSSSAAAAANLFCPNSFFYFGLLIFKPIPQ
jgi:hypothetical protein